MGKLVNFCLKESKLEILHEGKFSYLDKLLKDNKFGVAIYSFPDLNLVKANKIYINTLNNTSIKREKYFDLKVRELFEMEEEDILLRLFKKAIEMRETQIFDELYHNDFNGKEEYLKFTITPIIENNILNYTVITIRNVTEYVSDKVKLEAKVKKLMKEKEILQKENYKYKKVIESMTDGLILTDKNGNVEFLNEGAKEFIYNSEKFKFLGQTLTHTEYYDINSNKLSLNNLPPMRSLKGEKIKGMRIVSRRPDKVLGADISTSPIYDDNYEVMGSISSIRHLDDSLKIEKILKKQRDDFYNIIDNLDLLMCRFSYPEVNIIHYNKKAKEEFFDCNENADIIFKEALYEDLEFIEQMKKSGSIIHGSDIKITINGEGRYIDSFYQPIFNSNGEIDEIIKVGVDITNKVNYQKELEKILKTQEEFFSFIAHEFRTPLTVMSSTTQLINLIYRNQLSEKVKGYIDKINLSTLQQLRLVNNLLDISRASSGYLKVNLRNYDIINMSKVITESVRNFAIRKEINLEFKSKFSKEVIAIDDEKYERILLNLLSNAIKFTSNGKSVIVEIDSIGEFINIKVKDEGCGIPKEKQEIIFNRFGQVNNELTRKSEGTGIGLYLVKLLINSMGGEIKLESEIGKGSTFNVLLPNKKIHEEEKIGLDLNLMDNRLVQTMDIEFSNIYFE